MEFTLKKSYTIVFDFLRKHYLKTYVDELGGILSDMQIVGEWGTADPAAWGDWIKVVKNQNGYKLLHEKCKECSHKWCKYECDIHDIFTVTSEDAYTAMIDLLKYHNMCTQDKELNEYITELELSKCNLSADLYKKWVQHLEEYCK